MNSLGHQVYKKSQKNTREGVVDRKGPLIDTTCERIRTSFEILYLNCES